MDRSCIAVECSALGREFGCRQRGIIGHEGMILESCVLLRSIRAAEVVWDILSMLRASPVVLGTARGARVSTYAHASSSVIFLAPAVNWKERLRNFFAVMEARMLWCVRVAHDVLDDTFFYFAR